jgi:hypothetical protein
MSSRSENEIPIGHLGNGIPLVRGFLACMPVLLILAVSLSGCVTEQPTNGNPSPPPGVMIDYHRTGGIAGFDDHLVVFENGEAVISTRQGSGTFVLNAGSLKEIRDLMDKAQFTKLNSSYPAPFPGADYFSYEITYQGHTVTTEDSGVPEQLVPVIAELNEIVSAHRS